MESKSEAELRAELVATCRQLDEKGLIKGTSGNVSVRAGDGFLISPTGLSYSTMKPEQVVKVSWAGEHEGPILPSSEWRFHRDILAARPEFNAVVHTHSPHATAVSILECGIPAIHYRIAALGGPDIRCAPYALFGTQQLAEMAVEGMRDRRACLLAHHGVIAAHATLNGALQMAEIVEELARLYLLCLPMGPPPVLPSEAIAEVIERHKTYGQQPAAAMAHVGKNTKA